MESLYKIAQNRKTSLKNTGFDYKGQIFKRSMSSYLFNDPKRAEILNKLEELVYFLIEEVKTIKTFYNYTVDKDDKSLN